MSVRCLPLSCGLILDFICCLPASKFCLPNF
nr:MAG TPA: hypothetical protein [Caudoviricetes sp.]